MEHIFVNWAIPDEKDSRDYIFEVGLWAWEVMTKDEWTKGYDIEKVLGYKIKPKNQMQSYSCVGQANSLYKWILDALETSEYDEESAKAIYSQISLGYTKWAYLRDWAKILVEWGSLPESSVRSYKADGTTDETFMMDETWLTEKLQEEAKTYRWKDYKLITWIWIDYFARAIKDWFGCVIWVVWVNNWTWSSTRPVPPSDITKPENLWWHALYAWRFRLNNWKKEIWVLNSWGNVGEEWWQWLGEDWFANEWRWVFNPWVVIDQPNNNNIMSTSKILKDKNSAAVGIWMPAISEDVLKSYCANAGKEVPMKDGNIDWDKIVEGIFEYNK